MHEAHLTVGLLLFITGEIKTKITSPLTEGIFEVFSLQHSSNAKNTSEVKAKGDVKITVYTKKGWTCSRGGGGKRTVFGLEQKTQQYLSIVLILLTTLLSCLQTLQSSKEGENKNEKRKSEEQYVYKRSQCFL